MGMLHCSGAIIVEKKLKKNTWALEIANTWLISSFFAVHFIDFLRVLSQQFSILVHLCWHHLTFCKLLRLCLLISVFQQFPLSLELFGLLFCYWRVALLNYRELLVDDWMVGVKPCSQFSHSNPKRILFFFSILRWKTDACINEILGFLFGRLLTKADW